MSTRYLLIATGVLAVAGLGACQSRYSDVYSFKKNSFAAPVQKREELKAPTGDALQAAQNQPTGPAAAPAAAPGIPGVPGTPAPTAPGPATGIPGLDPAPAPAPAPAPLPPPPAQ